MSKRLQILVCDGPSCGVCYDGDMLAERMQARAQANPELSDRVFVTRLTCYGRCDEGPNMMVRELGADEEGEEEPDYSALDGQLGLYLGVDEALADRIVDEHCVSGTPIAGLAERY